MIAFIRDTVVPVIQAGARKTGPQIVVTCDPAWSRFSSRANSRGGTRTPDRVINSHLLYHLSYSGSKPKVSPSYGAESTARGIPVAGLLPLFSHRPAPALHRHRR